MGGLFHLVEQGLKRGLGGQLLYQQPTPQRPMYQLHIIPCNTIITFTLQTPKG